MHTDIKHTYTHLHSYTSTQLWWALFCAFSGQTLFNEWVIASFNIVFTGLPPIVLGVFERDASEKMIQRVRGAVL